MSIAIENLIPHRAPMRWIDTLDACDETTARATACFHAGDFPVRNGAVLETALVECVAQTAAAALAQRARTTEQSARAARGMLAAVSDFIVHSPPALGLPLRIEIRDIKRFGPLLLISGVVSCEERVIASGELTLYA